MKKIVCICVLSVFFISAGAQQVELKGKVANVQTGEALAGATVMVKATKISAIANNEGAFSLKTTPGTFVLIISYVGFQTAEMPVTVTDNQATAITILLHKDERPGSEIVISATKRAEKITDAPASIQVISKKELEQFTGSNAFELLSKVQGIEFVRTGVDYAGFNARGMNNAFNIKVFQLIDGRNTMSPLSGGLMMHNNSSMVKDDIERIEIVLGPQTALHGPNAHNAIVNVITKDPRKSQGTTVAVSAGNQYQFSGRFRQATKINNKWAYKLSGEYANGKDFEFYDSIYAGNQPGGPQIFGPPVTIPERNINFNFRHIRGEAHVYYSLTPKADIVLSTGGSNNNSISTHTAGHLQFIGMSNSFLQGRFVHPRFFINIYNAWADMGNSFNVGPHTMEYWNLTHRTAPPGPLTPEAAEVIAMRYGIRVKEKPQRFNAETQYNYTFEKAGLFLVTGLSFQKDKPRAFGIGLVDSFQRISITQYGAAVQVEKKLPWELRFIGAARWDNHSNFGNFFSPKLGLVKQLPGGNIRFTWARAYSMPSVNFQYGNLNGLFYGNGEGITYIPNDTKVADSLTRVTIPLKPEEVNTWELGYKGAITKKMYVDLTWYSGKSRNFFGPSVSIPGRALLVGAQRVRHNPAFAGTIDNNGILRGARFTTVSNFGDVKVYGLDAGLTYTFNKYIDFSVKYSWIGSDIKKGNDDNDANKDDTISVDERSLNSPRHRGIAILSFQNLCKQKLFVTLSVRYVEQFDFYSGNQVSTAAGEGARGIVRVKNPVTGQSTVSLRNFDWGPLGGFTSIDIGAGYKFNQIVSGGINITNLLNTKQREFAGSPSIGRLIMLELKINVPNSR